MSDFREDIKAYLDGELSPERATEVQAALEADPALREEVEFMKALGFEIKKMKAEPAVQGAEKAMASVRRRGRPWWLRLETYVAGAMGVLVLAAIFPVFAQSKEAAKASAALSAEKSGFQGVVEGGATGSTGTTGATGTTGTPGEAPASDMPADMGGRMMGRTDQAPGRGRGGGDEGLTLKGKAESLNGAVLLPGTGRTPQTPPSRALIPQLLIRTANLSVTVVSAEKALAASIRIAQSHGGYSSGDNLSVIQGALPTATVSLRVPVRSFEKVREQVLALGTTVENNSNTDDVTTQVADTEARLKVLRAEEESYVTMLRGARRIGDLMEIKDRLSSVRQEIESLDSQRKALRDQASYSTINATFTEKERIGEPAPPKEWSEDAWTSAVNGLKGVGRFLAQAVIFMFVYSPIWLPVVLFGWWISRRAAKG